MFRLKTCVLRASGQGGIKGRSHDGGAGWGSLDDLNYWGQPDEKLGKWRKERP